MYIYTQSYTLYKFLEIIVCFMCILIIYIIIALPSAIFLLYLLPNYHKEAFFPYFPIRSLVQHSCCHIACLTTTVARVPFKFPGFHSCSIMWNHFWKFGAWRENVDGCLLSVDSSTHVISSSSINLPKKFIISFFFTV